MGFNSISTAMSEPSLRLPNSFTIGTHHRGSLLRSFPPWAASIEREHFRYQQADALPDELVSRVAKLSFQLGVDEPNRSLDVGHQEPRRRRLDRQFERCRGVEAFRCHRYCARLAPKQFSFPGAPSRVQFGKQRAHPPGRRSGSGIPCANVTSRMSSTRRIRGTRTSPTHRMSGRTRIEKLVHGFEAFTVGAAGLLLMLAVAVATALSYSLFVSGIQTNLGSINSVAEMQWAVQRVFAGVLLLLLGLELLETLKTYLSDYHIAD